ncbi:fos-related antigen 2-like [Mizuhopecten yessoensis]|uniref:BZIP domain-containing protein n=1 Tax=Mizuhopecten yessoensis TaxID=6573 RepID=A0A210QVZ7_MIZYE|nr:fos-related antigen 2-like [Mizuhopecten yessoensis]OWF52939.1 hypothetical protein KP79_PYT22542 [Mizuhopecten yessoensis]
MFAGEEVRLSSPNTEFQEINNSRLQQDDELLLALSDEKIKSDLREKIRKRRHSEGLGDLEVKFYKPKEYEMRPEEKMKSESRKARNRRSARVSRDKRKRQEEELNKEIKDLEEENQKRKNYVINLQNFEKKLRLRFADHLIRCKSAEVTHLRQAVRNNNLQNSIPGTVIVGQTVNYT